ncbi:hypothetical protein MTR67_009243 [Solanum verrucosum]|uniref:SWIM-type domain-containing protein n=1 Tax=Solanum verrucosum TaxID=315347 RepID=A0AAF0Q3S5_SOLVR|nr:hypothetical protein MTR67_009243 [Solanum verrucosum]
MRDRVLTKVQATVRFVSGMTAPKLVNHKRIHTPKDIIADIRKFYGVQISYQQAWRAKERALEMIRGKPSAGYRQMPRYIYMLNTVYPNSYVRMQNTEEDEFMYLLVALRPLIKGFDYCRPIIVVDDAHMGGAYKGTFVSASTLDGASMVKEYLDDARYEKWSRVHSTVNRGRMMTSNIAECINGCLVEAQQLSILEFLEEVRILFDSWHCKNREIASYTNDTLGRRFEEVLIINASKSSKMEVVPSSEFIFSIYEAGRRYIVCLEQKVCSCGRFQLDEIPCAHAIIVLKEKNVKDMHLYCSYYYKSDVLGKHMRFQWFQCQIRKIGQLLKML